MITDEQITLMRGATEEGIELVASWLNSASLWQLVGMYLGFFISVCLIVFVIRRIFGMFSFFARD